MGNIELYCQTTPATLALSTNILDLFTSGRMNSLLSHTKLILVAALRRPSRLRTHTRSLGITAATIGAVGMISLWYFRLVTQTSLEAVMTQALMPSLGTIVFAGAVVVLTTAVTAMKAREATSTRNNFSSWGLGRSKAKIRPPKKTPQRSASRSSLHRSSSSPAACNPTVSSRT